MMAGVVIFIAILILVAYLSNILFKVYELNHRKERKHDESVNDYSGK
jgi:hypothetical protein